MEQEMGGIHSLTSLSHWDTRDCGIWSQVVLGALSGRIYLKHSVKLGFSVIFLGVGGNPGPFAASVPGRNLEFPSSQSIC